jgi:hypothetical protein
MVADYRIGAELAAPTVFLLRDDMIPYRRFIETPKLGEPMESGSRRAGESARAP